MTALFGGIDHAMVIVRNLDEARKQYQRLGFQTTPRGLHGGLGTGNHLMVLEHDYLELLGILEPDQRNLQMQQRLAAREGLWMVALATGDATALHQRFKAAGVPVLDLLSFERPVETPERAGNAAFTLTRLEAAASPHLGLFFCQHHTPDLVWVKAWQAHPNTAYAIREIIVTAPEAADAAGAYERLFGTGRFAVGDDAARLDTGGAPISFLPAAALAGRYGDLADAAPSAGPPCAAMRLAVRDDAVAAGVLRSNGIAHRTGPDGSIVVGPAEACGVILEFVAD